jgi:hypothetical protein
VENHFKKKIYPQDQDVAASKNQVDHFIPLEPREPSVLVSWKMGWWPLRSTMVTAKQDHTHEQLGARERDMGSEQQVEE